MLWLIAGTVTAVFGGGSVFVTGAQMSEAEDRTDKKIEAAEARTDKKIEALDASARAERAASEKRMIDYIDRAEERLAKLTHSMMEAHKGGPHEGAVSKEMFSEFRRALDASLSGVATKERQDMILERQKDTEEEVKRLRDKNGGS